MHGQVGSQRAAFNVLVSVIDDVGKPVPDADTGFSWGPIGWADSNYNRKNSDEMGVARFAGYARTDMYAYGATKQGYYPSRGIKGKFDKMDGARWQPWGQQLRVVLKPIKNPVPMYAKRVVAFLPVLGSPVGFDLERGDWVAPYGKGMRADWEFLGEGHIKNENDYDGTLTLRLPGNNNGIQAFDYPKEQRSELKLPCEAPVMDYASSWRWRSACGMKKDGARLVNDYTDESYPDRGFIYRVRTKMDEKGHVVEACHGKIHGPIGFSPRLNGKWAIRINYYFNPDGTRNLEFDPKKNLFPEEDVSEP